MASGTFPGSFWRRLLELVDAELEAEASMVIIGGAGSRSSTRTDT